MKCLLKPYILMVTNLFLKGYVFNVGIIGRRGYFIMMMAWVSEETKQNFKQWVNQNQLVVLGILLMLGIVFSVSIFSGAFVKTKQLEQSQLALTGFAQKDVTADQVEWRLQVTETAPTRQEAIKLLNKHFNLVKDFVMHGDIPEDALDEDPLVANTRYEKNSQGYDTNEIDGYELSKTLVVATERVSQVSTLVKTIGRLVGEGVPVQAQSPAYFYKNLDNLKLELIGQATKNAKDRAETMAKNTGGTVGSMVKASSGVFQITPKFSTEVSDYGTYDTSTIQKKVTSVVNVTFSVF